MALKFTQEAIKKLPFQASGQRIAFDAHEQAPKGFGLRITKTRKSFILDYRMDARQWRLKIGEWPGWSVTAARTEATQLRRRIDRGENPARERADRAAEPNVADLVALYEKEWAAHKRDGKGDMAMLNGEVLPRFGSWKASDMTRAEIRAMHREITERGAPIRANRVLACCSKMFQLAIDDWEYLTVNPCKGVRRNPENRIERFLSPNEITAVSKALQTYPGETAADAVRMCMLTGARRGEVMRMAWGEVDFERGRWIKPSAHTKQKKDHAVPLSAPALALLAKRKEAANAGEFVFPGRKGDAPIKQLHKVWAHVRNETGLHDIRIHDLRHTFASILVSSGASLEMIGALLGHTQPQTTARYSHLFDDPLRDAAERAGAHVQSAGRGDVVPFKGAAR